MGTGFHSESALSLSIENHKGPAWSLELAWPMVLVDRAQEPGEMGAKVGAAAYGLSHCLKLVPACKVQI